MSTVIRKGSDSSDTAHLVPCAKSSTTRTMKAFLEKYKGRVMVGTDMGSDKQMYLDWWRLLEMGDQYMKGRIWWPYYGLELSEAVLKSLYRDTALKVLNFK